ncbi:MAG: lipoyl synthase [Lentisphaeria bacterium]|nr:lipoyl synthase [Lentisphaeria bacterium]
MDAAGQDPGSPGAGGRLPPWLRTRFTGGSERRALREVLRDLRLHTVCESARCPNLCECWRRRAATFMLLGDVCTRDCRFCAVRHGVPLAPEASEPGRVAAAVCRLGLRFVVLTCVTRDDLADGGASHIARTVAAIKAEAAGVGVEALVSDFAGATASVDRVMAGGVDVFNHNIETVERLTPRVRDRADYRRSLAMLRHAAGHRPGGRSVRIKSGLMLGLGESDEEIRACLTDLRGTGVEAITLGQYLRPTRRHWPVARYVTPEEFAAWEREGLDTFGFAAVVSGPLVRSSYMAEEQSGSHAGEGAAGTGTRAEPHV